MYMCVPVSHFGRMVTWLMHFPALHSRFGDAALFYVCAELGVRGEKVFVLLEFAGLLGGSC